MQTLLWDLIMEWDELRDRRALKRKKRGFFLGFGRLEENLIFSFRLVRVGIEKEHGLSPDSKMVVLHDFTPCVDDELEVKRGQIVNILYRENDWVYVIGQDTRQEGFIPHSYCAPYTTAELANLANKKKLPREAVHDVCDISVDIIEEAPDTSSVKHSLNSLNSEPDFLPFQKDPSGRYIVLYTFIARDENDVSVERGEFVTVLNREDPEWFWIVRTDGQEGFIPSGFVYPAETILQSQAQKPGLPAESQPVAAPVQQQAEQHHGTELIMLYDFKAQAPDDLSVRRGDWIYADLKNQTVEGWLWSYSPKTRNYGFIPKAYARPFNKPLTSL